jgi:hypothetical protein
LGPVFMFFAPGLVFGAIECVKTRFPVLRARTHFRYRGHWVPFSSFPLLDLFSVPRASVLVFMFYVPRLIFCAPGLVFGGTEGVRFRFHVLRSLTCVCRYGGCRVPFSCFARPDTFSVETRVPGTLFMFCAPRGVSRGTMFVGSCFHVFRSRTHFRRYRGHRVPFWCFVRPDSFFSVPRASIPVFMFCAPGHVFGGTKGVGSRFQVLRAHTGFDGLDGDASSFYVLLVGTLFRRYRGCRVPFSCFAHPNSFPVVPRASGPAFMFCAPGLLFDGTEGVGSRFHILRSRTHFRRYRWRPVLFSCFALPGMFSAMPSGSGPVFMFCAFGLIFGDLEGNGSRFHVLQSGTSLWRYGGRRVPFSCFTPSDIFSAVRRASGPVFMF